MKAETKAWLILIVLSLVWGASFFLIDKSMQPVEGIHVFSPYQLGSLRTVIAGLVLMPIALRNLRYLDKKNTPFLIAVGLCGNFLPAFLFPMAETEIQSAVAGLLNMGTSVFVIIFGWLFFNDKITKVQLLGFSLGVLGLTLILFQSIDANANNFFYAIYIVIATACYATSLSLIKHRLQHLKPEVITALAFFIIFVPALLSAIGTGAFPAFQFTGPGSHSTIYLLILSVLGTAVAVLLFNQLVAIATPLFTSSVTYLMPVVALILGLSNGETFPPLNYLWMLLIFAGLYFMGKKPQKQTKKQVSTKG